MLKVTRREALARAISSVMIAPAENHPVAAYFSGTGSVETQVAIF